MTAVSGCNWNFRRCLACVRGKPCNSVRTLPTKGHIFGSDQGHQGRKDEGGVDQAPRTEGIAGSRQHLHLVKKRKHQRPDHAFGTGKKPLLSMCAQEMWGLTQGRLYTSWPTTAMPTCVTRNSAGRIRPSRAAGWQNQDDAVTKKQVAEELGHSRADITNHYLGKDKGNG